MESRYGYEASLSGGIRINFIHLGFLEVNLILYHTGVLAIRSHRNTAAMAENRTLVLDLSSATPYLLNYHGGSTCQGEHSWTTT